MSKFDIGDKVLIYNTYKGEVFGIDKEKIYAVKYKNTVGGITHEIVHEEDLKKLPKFDVGDKVKWGDTICIIKYATPERNNIDNEYEYVIKIIKGKYDNEGKYYFLLEGNLEKVDN